MQLHRFRSEFESRQTQILLIGFEKTDRAREWLQRASVSFPFLMDQTREVYRTYGIERSYQRTLHPRVLWFYAKRFLTGKGLPAVRADPIQQGSDILIDRNGIVREIYAGTDIMDRPSVESILDAIDLLKGG